MNTNDKKTTNISSEELLFHIGDGEDHSHYETDRENKTNDDFKPVVKYNISKKMLSNLASAPLNKSDYSVILYLISNCEFHVIEKQKTINFCVTEHPLIPPNFIGIFVYIGKQEYLAKTTNLAPSSVSKAVKSLMKNNYIYQPKQFSLYFAFSYILHPSLFEIL